MTFDTAFIAGTIISIVLNGACCMYQMNKDEELRTQLRHDIQEEWQNISREQAEQCEAEDKEEVEDKEAVEEDGVVHEHQKKTEPPRDPPPSAAHYQKSQPHYKRNIFCRPKSVAAATYATAGRSQSMPIILDTTTSFTKTTVQQPQMIMKAPLHVHSVPSILQDDDDEEEEDDKENQREIFKDEYDEEEDNKPYEAIPCVESFKRDFFFSYVLAQ